MPCNIFLAAVSSFTSCCFSTFCPQATRVKIQLSSHKLTIFFMMSSLNKLIGKS
ncbi:Uncharacterised protein [Segatella copri]|nr:Uncharacterised protein [Segatella copri]